jgi:phage tail sheath protein FI
MPPTLTFRGVYVEEIPSGVHPITGVATSITAFVGFAERGPVNEPTLVLGFSDFVRVFGGCGSRARLATPSSSSSSTAAAPR